ncbi:MAB_1171c family putative transporter [Streptomyces sp. NPDC006367]|uniref:MAB_1171c family putative transporter n=1 Tax=unclassified Streptomyces TaxID=2593676 RepID=UPI0033B32D62
MGPTASSHQYLQSSQYLQHFHIPYALPTALLVLAVLLKLPTFVRAWRNPEVRATTVLLACAACVLVVITPVNIERLNAWTGVPNFASPFAYSFLTASGATGLAMITRWRQPPSERRRRGIRRIHLAYGGVVAGLWVTFLLASVPEPRIYDLDTYYAGTPWMREHILLYLGAHAVTGVVATRMLRQWSPAVTDPWVRSGVVLLLAGFASGLVFDAAKLTAVAARWCGADWDVLSTRVAPPFALLQASLVAVGFIVPQAGPALRNAVRDQREHLRLRPLWRALRVLAPAAAQARFGLWVPLDLRVMQRRQRIHDALRLLAPYYRHDVHERALAAARAAAHDEARARGLAGAIALRDAIDAYTAGVPAPASASGRPPGIGTDISDHIGTISLALYRRRALADLGRRATSTESGLDAHV